MTTFWCQLVTDEARSGTAVDVFREAVPTGRDSTRAGRFHGPLERRVHEIRQTSSRRVSVITRVLRTPGMTRTVDGRNGVQQRRRPVAVCVSGSGHVTAVTAAERQKDIGDRRLAAMVVRRRRDVVRPSYDHK